MTIDYDQLWNGHWGDLQDIGPVHRHSAKVIIDLLRPLSPSSLADVGCGNGANLVAIGRELEISDLTGFDVSPRALAVAERRVPGGRFSVVDLENEDLEGRYDAVLSAQVIEHLRDDEAFLRKLRSITGRWCIVATMQGKMRPSEVHIGHLRNYGRRELEDKMSNAGFRVVETIEWGFPFYSPIYRSLIEHIGGQAAEVGHRRRDRVLAGWLYQVYRLNRRTRGDVLTVLAEAV